MKVSSRTRALNTLDIAYEISSWLTLVEATRTKGITPTWHDAIDHRHRVALHPRRLAGAYFDDWERFLGLMASRDVLLTGLPILDIFDERPVQAHARSLEILVEAPMGLEIMTYAQQQGYMELSDETSAALPSDFVMPAPFTAQRGSQSCQRLFVVYVVRMVRPATHSRQCRVIDVVCTSYAPAMTVVRFDNSTCYDGHYNPLVERVAAVKMTFYSWNRVYCLFPITTLYKRRGLFLDRGVSRFRAAACEAMGFELGTYVDVSRDAQNIEMWGSLGPQMRWFGDERTLAIDLDVPEVNSLRGSPYDLAMNSFDLWFEPVSGPTKRDITRGSVYIPKVTSLPLADRSLHGWSYAASPHFFTHVYEYIRRLSRSHGMFWRFGENQNAVLDNLRSLRESLMRRRDSVDDGENMESDTDSLPALMAADEWPHDDESDAD
ncbi:hypothetical protein AURDEDRAFT_120320 [Auricularia subglabra TFB-10046 SS5]|nr:hypothetical protein AURDEDRAFT_120320 [Auricularia subglabra TFB-10046 SS5]